MTTDPAFWHRLQFAFTVTYHYLFPQLTMGVVGFLVYWTWRGQQPGGEPAAAAARFWTRIFGLTFALGVVTGIPMEFQFGTNWADFSRYAGAVIGQTLAMEGMFAFFLESAFVGAFDLGRKTAGSAASFPRGGSGCFRELAFRLLHSGHQRFHATSGGLSGRTRWLDRNRQS